MTLRNDKIDQISRDISIHTTARVVTMSEKFPTKFVKISIHTTARVVTGELDNAALVVQISIHTTARVVTAKAARCMDGWIFQSTPPHGW